MLISGQKYQRRGQQDGGLIFIYQELRDAVFDLQRRQIREPGLVAEGRDMTSAVFPDACVKIFLDVYRPRKQHAGAHKKTR